MDNIEMVLPAANLLQATSVLDECKKWMKENVSEENCFNIRQLAAKFNLQCFEDKLNKYIQKNFVAISETDAFAEISKEDLIECISSNLLKTNAQEYAVYNAAKIWVLANEAPAKVVAEIMSYVRFGLIPAKTLHQEIAVEGVIDDNKECRKMISEAQMYHTNVYCQPFYKGSLNKPRGRQGMFILQNGQRTTKGYNTHGDSVKIHFLALPKLNRVKWSSSLDIQMVHSSLKSIHVSNFVYLFGTSCEGYQNFAKRYDVSTDTWLELAAVPKRATVGSAVVRIEKQIFFLGGMTVTKSAKFTINPRSITDFALVYDIPENKWSSFKKLPQKLVYSAVSSRNGQFFISGGHSDKDETVKNTWGYSPDAKIWMTLADMNHARCKHVLETVGDKLYAIGGEVVNSGLTATFEEYDPCGDQWTVVLGECFICTFSTSFVHDSQIYLVGGSEFERQVHCYDPEKSWLQKVDGRIPSPCGCNASEYVVIPM